MSLFSKKDILLKLKSKKKNSRNFCKSKRLPLHLTINYGKCTTSYSTKCTRVLLHFTYYMFREMYMPPSIINFSVFTTNFSTSNDFVFKRPKKCELI